MVCDGIYFALSKYFMNHEPYNYIIERTVSIGIHCI